MPFDEDLWELYHVAEDFSETRRPRRAGARAAARAHRPVVVRGRAQPSAAAEQPAGPPRRSPLPPRSLRVPRRHRLAPADVAPNLRNRGYRMTAELDIPTSGGDGVIVTHGGHAGGSRCTLRTAASTGRTTSSAHSTRRSRVRIRSRPARARSTLTFTPTGRFQGDIVIARDDVPNRKGHVAQTTPVTYGIIGVHRRLPTGNGGVADVQATVHARSGILQRIVIEPDGLEYRDPPAEQRASVAMQ